MMHYSRHVRRVYPAADFPCQAARQGRLIDSAASGRRAHGARVEESAMSRVNRSVLGAVLVTAAVATGALTLAAQSAIPTQGGRGAGGQGGQGQGRGGAP